MKILNAALAVLVSGVALAEPADGGLPVSANVKGRENVYANPIIKELPKHADSASRTLTTMLEIIKKLGYKQEKETALGLFDKEFE